MWIMTPFGIIMPSQRSATSMNGDARSLQVRARDRRALKYLRDHYMGGELSKIVHTPERDYEYRAYCTPIAFAEAMTAMVLDINYEKFKPQAEKVLGPEAGGDLHTLYVRIWHIVAQHYDSPILRRYDPKNAPAKGYAWAKTTKKGRH